VIIKQETVHGRGSGYKLRIEKLAPNCSAERETEN
jgi:hypothetical protein